MNINTCSLNALLTAKGVGPKAAKAIVDARPLLSWEAVASVKGVGPRAIDALKAIGAVVGAPSPEDQLILDRRARAAERASEGAFDAREAASLRARDAAFDAMMDSFGAPVEVIKPLCFEVGGVKWIAPMGAPTGRGGEIVAFVGGREWRVFKVGGNPWRIKGVSGSRFASANLAARWVATQIQGGRS